MTTTPPEFDALHVSRTAEILVAAEPDDVFPLFEPEGERAWVPRWSPRYLWPADGIACVGMVFLTSGAEGEPETIWTVAEHNPVGHRVVYARTTPGHRAAFVEVRCRAAETGGGTVASITYSITALSHAGNEYVRAFTEEWYRGYLAEWETALNAHLTGGRGS